MCVYDFLEKRSTKKFSFENLMISVPNELKDLTQVEEMLIACV